MGIKLVSNLKLYKNYKKNIKELFYALPVSRILLKYHRQVPAPGPNF